MPQAAPIIRTLALSHGFGDLPVLNGLDLTLAEGEIVALLGPSGCGKSTLLNILGGVLQPGAGSVQIGRGARVATVFQAPTLLPWRSVAGNIALALEPLGLPPKVAADRIAASLALVGLTDFAAHRPGTLSGGMRQRANLARALATDPQILLMDEPLSGLDEAIRDQLLADLTALWQARRFTCLYVTHSPTEALRLGHRIVVLSARPATVLGEVRLDLPHDQRRDDHPEVMAARARLATLTRARHAA